MIKCMFQKHCFGSLGRMRVGVVIVGEQGKGGAGHTQGPRRSFRGARQEAVRTASKKGQ